MDAVETGSNASDSPSSNFSSLSGLTGFEEEFYGIKSLIDSKIQPFYADSINNNVNRSTLLNTELLAINEKYKNDLSDLERKIELATHQKFNKLLKHNLQLEAELSNCNNRIVDLTSKGAAVPQQHHTVEHELHHKDSELKRWKNQVQQLEVLNNALKLKYEEAKIDLDTKTTSIQGLKQKIVDMHMEIQSLNLNSTKLSNDLHIAHNNFNSLKKSELWYKEQLHATRSQKLAIVQELTQLRSVLINKEHQLQTRNNECSRLSSLLEKNTEATQPDPSTDTDAYVHTINTLKTELLALKNAVEAQKDSFELVAEENSELHTRNLLLSKTNNDKDALITNLENDCKDLANKVDDLEVQMKETSDMLLKSAREKSEVAFALVEAKREKNEVECAINLIRNDFAKFVEKYNNTKAQLNTVSCSKRLFEEEKAELESVNEKLLQGLQNSSAKLKEVESECLIQQEQVQALQSLLESNGSKLRELDEKCLESRRINELLHGENQVLRDRSDGEKRALRRLKQRLRQIEGRCKTLHRQNLADEEDLSALQLMSSFKVVDENECVKNLKALCRAKDLEMKEKRLKYENNYRTLLRKVKEHMRGRNAAEKSCLHLQELYNAVFEELNSCKLQAATNNFDFQKQCQKLNESEVKNKSEIVRLEKELAALVVHREEHNACLKTTIAQMENEIGAHKNEFKQKLALIERLEKDNASKAVVIGQLEDEKQLSLVKSAELCFAKNELERLLNQQQGIAERYALEQERLAECVLELEDTKRLLQQAHIQNEILTEDINCLTRELEFKVAELADSFQQKHLLEMKSRKEVGTISDLQSDVQMLQSELSALKSDKYFLQRLCNDLKFALTTTKNQSDVLKKHVQALSVEYSSLPNFVDTPSPRQFDDAYVSELLQQSISLPVDPPLNNLHTSLNLLKNEMATLRHQVIGTVRYK